MYKIFFYVEFHLPIAHTVSWMVLSLTRFK